MTLKDFELSINLLIQTWLTPSLGTASYAENRVKFDEALKLALIEKLRLTNNDAVPLANTNLIKIKNESTLILCKTINTNYVYYPCIEHTPLNEKLNSINIEHDIADLSRWMTDLHKKNIENAFIIFILYPCTHNDRDWSQYHNIINDLIPQKLFHIDFRFANNAPGVLYYAKVEISESELIKIQALINKYYPLDKLTYKTYDIQSNRIRERIKFKDAGTYFKVLQNIQKELLLNKKVIKVSELQEIFESRIKEIIIKENPTFSAEQIKESLKTFDSKGTGAKKAQILLNTVNEKNRIHYRPKIDIDSPFNLFIYDEIEPENIKFINRNIKAFDINDESVLDKTLYYSIKSNDKRESIPVKIKESILINNKLIDMKKVEKKSGMIVALDWNSNNWRDEATALDIKNCTFAYVKATKFSFTCANFGHEVYKPGSTGMYRGLIPHLWDSMPNKDESRFVKIVFMKSKNYNDKKTYIVGFYAYPVFCFTQKMPSPILNFTGEFMYNLEAKPSDIHYLDVKINLTDDKEAKKYIPSDKEFGKMGYNYITKQNVEKLLDKITLLNPNDKKFSKIKLSILRSML